MLEREDLIYNDNLQIYWSLSEPADGIKRYTVWHFVPFFAENGSNPHVGYQRLFLEKSACNLIKLKKKKAHL